MNTNNNTITGAQNPSSESTKAQQNTMPEPLRPRWCVQRDDNTVVPLIAIDELPDSILLKGVPFTLTILEALRARMELIGDHPAHGVRYELDQPAKSPTVANEEGDEYVSDESHASESSIQEQSAASGKKGNKNEEAKAKDKGPKAPTLTTNDTSIFDTMAKKGTMGKKVYCTYWIQTGNCNYMQEGCKYKHEIPKDEETRRAIGFREFPNWPREEMPVHTKPATALHKPWRRQDGKPEFAGAPGSSNHAAAPSTAAQGTPVLLTRGNSQAPAGITTRNPQYNPNATAFAAPHQHFPNHVNHMAQQRPLPHGAMSFLGGGAAESFQQRSAQNTPSPPSYDPSTAHVHNGDRSTSSSPPKQPPISRPSKQGQSSAGQQANNTGPSFRKVAPDYHIMNRAGAPASSGARVQSNTYSGLPNNWNPQTNAPTSMDISFIAPPSDSTTHPLYTPTSASTTPTLNQANPFAATSSRAGTPSFATRDPNPVPVKGRGQIQFGRLSPQPHASAAEDSDAASVPSPPVQHRVFFREPGQPEFVTNGPEPKAKAAHSLKGKHGHGRKAGANGNASASGGKSARSKMSGNGYEVLLDTNERF